VAEVFQMFLCRGRWGRFFASLSRCE